MDGLEATANAIVGLAVSVAAVHLLWPIFGWPVTGAQSVSVSAVFFALSWVRSYTLRRLFRSVSKW